MKAIDWRLVLHEDVLLVGEKQIVTRSFVEVDIAVRCLADLQIPVFQLPKDPFVTYQQHDGLWSGFPIVSYKLPEIMEVIEIYPFVGEWGKMLLAKVEARERDQLIAISGSIIDASGRLKSLAVRAEHDDNSLSLQVDI